MNETRAELEMEDGDDGYLQFALSRTEIRIKRKPLCAIDSTLPLRVDCNDLSATYYG